jgi:hypothetical protein
MKTTALLDRLAADSGASRPMASTLATGLLPGAIVSFVLMMLFLGLRPDFPVALSTMMFWEKLAYATAIAFLALPLVFRLSRPDGIPRRAWFLAVPVLVIVLLGLGSMARADPVARMSLLMGSSSRVCALRIFLLSLPILVGALLSLRGFAPTRLAAAGAAAGVLSGAIATLIYALSCGETAAPFVAVWYTLGMTAAGLFGGFVGRWALRW